MHRVIVMDMDGTLLKDDKTISEKTKATLIHQQELGATLILASGRVKTRMLSFAEELKMDKYGGYFVEANGSVLYDLKKDEREIISFMKYEEAEELFLYLRSNYPTHEIMIMGNVNAYIHLPEGMKESIFFNTNNMESLNNRKIIPFKDVHEIKEVFYKVCIYKDKESIELIMKDIQSHFKGKYWCGRTMPIWCEMMNSGVNKGNALAKLMEKHNFKREDTYIFGDGENDISMLSLGHSIAMGNALASVKRVCEYITDSNEEDGIANFIEKYL